MVSEQVRAEWEAAVLLSGVNRVPVMGVVWGLEMLLSP